MLRSFGRLGGFYSQTGIASGQLAGDDRVFTLKEAGGAIPIGAAVSLDVSTNEASYNPNGTKVVVADSDSAGGGNVFGLYTGGNLTNIQANKTGVSQADNDGANGYGGAVALEGVAAVANDAIEVQIYGPGFVIAEGTTDILSGDTLTPNAAGELTTATDLTDGSAPTVQALAPLTEAADGLVACFIRAL